MKFLQTKAYWKRFFIIFAGIIIVINFFSFLRLCSTAFDLYTGKMECIVVERAVFDLESFIDTIKDKIMSFLIYSMMAAMGAVNGPPGSED